MKLIGNYRDWITTELWTALTTRPGDRIPVWQPDRWQGNPTLDAARKLAEPAYGHRNCDFQMFTATSKDLEGIEITLPIPLTRSKYNWWFVKYRPGQLQPMHYDPEVTEVKNALRYTMMLDDYHPGHIYTYDNVLLTGYRAGDMFQWPDAMSYHGAANIGFKDRYTFQLTMYD